MMLLIPLFNYNEKNIQLQDYTIHHIQMQQQQLSFRTEVMWNCGDVT